MFFSFCLSEYFLFPIESMKPLYSLQMEYVQHRAAVFSCLTYRQIALLSPLMMTINKDEDFYFLSLLLLIFLFLVIFAFLFIYIFFYWNDIFFIETTASSVSAFFLITKVITMRKIQCGVGWWGNKTQQFAVISRIDGVNFIVINILGCM